MKNKHLKLKEIIIWVDLGYTTFGIIKENNIIIDAAPIMKWAIGKEWPIVKQWIEKRGRWEFCK